jgi:hypothetical protein
MSSPAAVGYIKMVELHDYIQFFLVVILFFVLWFYVTIILDFGEFNTKQEPLFELDKTYTHTVARNIAHIGWLEVIWTIIPILILTAIAIPSFKLLYALDVVNSPFLTLRCIGNQWYWTYECNVRNPSMLQILKRYLKATTNLNTSAAVTKRVFQRMPADELFTAVRASQKMMFRNSNAHWNMYGIEPDPKEIEELTRIPDELPETYKQVYSTFRGQRRRVGIKLSAEGYAEMQARYASMGYEPWVVSCDVLPSLAITSPLSALTMAHGIYLTERYTYHVNRFAFG